VAQTADQKTQTGLINRKDFPPRPVTKKAQEEKYFQHPLRQQRY